MRFANVEQAVLQPLPASPYEPSLWKQVKLHRDCHVVFEKSYYPAPHRLIGQPRSTQRYTRRQMDDEQLLTERIVALAASTVAMVIDG